MAMANVNICCAVVLASRAKAILAGLFLASQSMQMPCKHCSFSMRRPFSSGMLTSGRIVVPTLRSEMVSYLHIFFAC